MSDSLMAFQPAEECVGPEAFAVCDGHSLINGTAEPPAVDPPQPPADPAP